MLLIALNALYLVKYNNLTINKTHKIRAYFSFLT